MFIDGVTLIKEISTLNIMGKFIILLFQIFILVVLMLVLKKAMLKSWCRKVAVSFVLILVGSIAIRAVPEVCGKVHYLQEKEKSYQVEVAETVDMNRFYQLYEIVENQDNKYTIKIKEGK